MLLFLIKTLYTVNIYFNLLNMQVFDHMINFFRYLNNKDKCNENTFVYLQEDNIVFQLSYGFSFT